MKFCTLASGSNGNSSVLINEKKHILIDAGYSNRALCNFMSELGVDHAAVGAVFITHEHSDHVKGLSVFLKKHEDCKCFASRKCADALGEYFPEIAHRIEAFDIGDRIECFGAKIDTIRTPHDTPESVSYYIEKNNKKILIATDLGYVPEELEKKIENLDVFMIEANYDENKLEYGHYPRFLKDRIAGDNGHLSNTAAAEIVLKACNLGTRRVLLSHLSEENNTPTLAYNKVHAALTAKGIIPGVDVDLQVSPRGMCGRVIEL